MNSCKNICVAGAGAIGTAIAHILAEKSSLSVHLWSKEKDVIRHIQEEHINVKYYPNIKLHHSIHATSGSDVFSGADIIFLAIPSNAVAVFAEEHAKSFHTEALIVNLAKGFGIMNQLITENLNSIIPNPVLTMKGPSFARELMNSQPTAFTLGAGDKAHFGVFKELFEDTNIYLDYSSDIRGVELSSILKNIYAIAIGIIDANFDSPNLRSLMLTRALNEMRRLLILFGGMEKTIFNYCGFGDFTLTALNDLSRNRTLGLLIGKGFFTDNISEKVVLEGRIAVNVLQKELEARDTDPAEFPIIHELYKVFNQAYDASAFVDSILEKSDNHF